MCCIDCSCTPRDEDPKRRVEWGECTRNTECSHDKICRNRKCVSIPLLPPATMLQPPTGMTHVPAGEFTLGSNRGLQLERPQIVGRTIDFFIDIHEVTKEEYQRCVEAGHCPPPVCPQNEVPNVPVTCVTQPAAAAYCAFVGKRLPTEEEWEKAARGTDARTYPWGETSPDCNRAVYRSCVQENAPLPVGGRTAGKSPYGTMDQSGNVWEWTATSRPLWDKEKDPRRLQGGYDPPKTEESVNQTTLHNPHFIIRGGSFLDDALSMRTTLRFLMPANFTSRALGFRCAADPNSISYPK